MLVLLPRSNNALMAQWHEPYEVLKQVGKVTYCIDMHNRHKQKRVFHVNKLHEFAQQYAGCLIG